MILSSIVGLISSILIIIVFTSLGLLALTVIVVVHELGHFIAAKKAGVWVEEFGIGLPPRIFGKKIGDTLYSINLLPFGGFVRLHGETLDSKVSDKDRAFTNKSGRTRSVIALAGIFMNVVLAFACFTIVYSIVGIETQKDLGYVRVLNVESGSPAQTAGVLPDDIIVSVDGKTFTSTDEFIPYVNENRGKRLQFILKRSLNGTDEELKFSITPREQTIQEQGALGVVITSTTTEVTYPPLWQRPIIGLQKGTQDTINVIKAVVFGFGQITKDVTSGKAPEGLVGLPGILAIFWETFKRGVPDTLYLTGIISLNLAIFNILPFPPLDGSRVMFVVAEKIFGKKSLPRIEMIAHSTGMILLLLLMLVITGRELPVIFQKGTSGYVDSLIK